MPAFQYPPSATEILPDHAGDRHRFRFKVRSSSGNGQYVVAYDAAPGAGYWACSCPCGIHRGHCKHLDSAGLLGRRYGRSPLPELAPAVAERQAVAVRRARKSATEPRRRAVAVSAPNRRTLATKKAESMTAEEAFILSASPELLASLGTI